MADKQTEQNTPESRLIPNDLGYRIEIMTSSGEEKSIESIREDHKNLHLYIQALLELPSVKAKIAAGRKKFEKKED